jgi:hypothetical protein
MMVLQNKYELGQMVFLKTDPDQHARQLTQIAIGANGSLRYAVTFGTQETWHYEIEMSDEKNVLVS